MIPTCDDVVVIDDFLSPEECQKLIDTYSGKVDRSLVVGNAVHANRTSSTYYMPRNDAIVKKILQKSAQLLNMPERNIEGLQFLRYLHGEEYKYHHDYFWGEGVPTNQRVYTVLLYLNTLQPEDGGATSFFHYKKKVSPKVGRVAIFKNMKDDGTGNERAMHAGEPILTEGTVKYAVNIWVRQNSWL